MKNWGAKRSRRMIRIWKRRFPEFIGQMEEIRETITDKDILNKSIDELEFSVRANNCLQHEGVRTINELIKKDPYELLFIKNMGVRTVKGIMEKLQNRSWGLKL
tara:strand:+ start:243 stop:554 length:312 start_codon:yes stop_codon:yes gene_type:complete